MDSAKIAVELEKGYPSPSPRLGSPIVPKVQRAVRNTLITLTLNVVPKAPQNLLNEPPKEYFECTIETRFSMLLSQMEKEMAGEAPWEAAKQPIKELSDLLKKQGGPFSLG